MLPDAPALETYAYEYRAICRLLSNIVNMVDIKSSDRGLPSHKFMPILGVHNAFNTDVLTFGSRAG